MFVIGSPIRSQDGHATHGTGTLTNEALALTEERSTSIVQAHALGPFEAL